MALRFLRPFGRLDRYVGSLFIASYATALLSVVGLYLVLDMSANLDDYFEPGPDGWAVGVPRVVAYYVLELPFKFLEVAPFVSLVAALFTVGRLMKNNELVAALGAGVSAQRMLLPVFALAALAGAGMFVLREALSVSIATKRDALRYVLEEKREEQVYEQLRLKDARGGRVHFAEFRPRGPSGAPEGRGLEAISYSAARTVTVTADRAVWVEDGSGEYWQLENGVRQEQVTGAAQATEAVTRLEGFDATPELALTYWRARASQLELGFLEARELARRDPDNVAYRTLLQHHVTFPLANLVLLLVGLPILVRHDRRRGPEGLAIGGILCVFYFAADFVLRNLGLQGSIDPMLSAWLPVLFFGSLGLVLFDAMKT